MRARKPKNIDEKLIKYGDKIVSELYENKGSWAQNFGMPSAPVKLDIGCGKGSFAIGTAQNEPQSLIIGIDTEPICVAMSARNACEANINNAMFAIADADELQDMFAPSELSAIYLNFSTPMPKKKCADRRLTYADRLLMYRSLLCEDGCIFMKTDSRPLFEWSLVQFELAGFKIEWQTDDAHADKLAGVTTDVEKKLQKLGAKVSALKAVPRNPPAISPQTGRIEQTVSGSLVDFLPDDLESMTHIPYGMESTVENLINRRKKERHLKAMKSSDASRGL